MPILKYIFFGENKNICPIGTAGEIYISGDGVGNGYLYNTELNEKSFLENPFIPNSLMYKTGDLGLYNENNEIVYLNRIDNQVKIRGFRIELEEIEKIIFNFPDIKNCVVMKKTLSTGHDTLCAYYIENNPININELKKTLQQNLPVYMVPQYFIKMDDFPYTQNGKIDRKNLPLPTLHTTNSVSVKPRNNTDIKLIEFVKKLFNVDTIGITDNLFELGMDSLIAINLSVQILNEFNVQINISDIFDNPTIKDLADFICNAVTLSSKSTIKPCENLDFYPVSTAQKRIYYATLVDGNTSILYNVSGAILFDKLPDLYKMNNCINELLNRHESFNTYFTFENNELVQKINKEPILFSLPLEKVNTNNIDTIVKTFIEPFDLSQAPLFRAKLVEFKNKSAALIIDTHHIICDGTSLNILIRDLCNLYNSSKLPTLDITYKDFAVWEMSENKTKSFKESEEFWIKQLEGDIPVLNLPTTFTRPASKTYNGDLLVKNIENSLFNKIKNISKKYNLTPNIIMLSAYYILLYKYTNQNNIIVGSPVIGRTLPELNNIIGMFVNTLPLKTNINPNISIKAFLKNIKEMSTNAFSHQNYPFDMLVSKINAPRDNSRNFLFDVLFTYQTNTYSNMNFDNLIATHYRANDKTSKFDISLEVLPCNDYYELTFEYCTNLFNADYIDSFSEHYINTLEYILDNLDSKISEVSILSDIEKNKILYSFNNTGMQYNKNKSLTSLFEEQVNKTPNNIATVFENSSLTYSELNKKANQLAWYLKDLKIGENSIIGIMLPRSLEILISMLGILKTGACYIPIDPSLPENRIEYMLENSNADFLLTFDETIQKFDISKLNVKKIINVNLNNTDIYSGKYKNLDLKINPEAPSYLIYTSGSTGKPKGVLLKHGALTNLTNYLNNNVEFLKDEYANLAMVSITTISFDIFIFETLICLQRGLKIIIANESEQNTPVLLNNLINKYDAKCIQMTPSRMSLFLENQDSMPHLSNLKYITLAGEALPNELRDSILKLGDITIYNGYGPSETTVFSTFTDVTNYKEINIGKPLGNTQIYILDKDLKPVPINHPGELYISGDGLAIEYINNETITKERFIKNPFLENSLMYKTGDLAKFLPNGELSYIGRVDNQVKIRGLRIELDEIEKCILKFNNIEKCIISAKTDSNNRQYIVAYLIINKKISINALRDFLKEMLPKYMIPSYFVILDEIPYLPNGKINKKALPQPDLSKQTSSQKYIAPKTKLELQLVNIFQNLLSIYPIGIKDNFFELGGDSLLAINLQIELAKFTNAITYADIFLNPTVYDLAQKIKNTKNSTNSLNTVDLSEYITYNKLIEKNNILLDNYEKSKIGNIFISGATGFLGVHILNEFLETQTGIAYCMVRSESGLDIKQKLLNKLHYYFGNKFDKLIDDRIIIINSDIAKPNLGMTEDELTKTFSNISCVINSAAKVSHFGHYDLFKKINVDGVENLLKLCKKFNKKFYHVSTVSVSENNFKHENSTDLITFSENNFYINQNLNNVYIRSKFEAEKIILDYISEGLDAYIFRVGNLMNRITDMKFQENINENAFVSRLKSFIKIEAIPKYLENEYLEFTPVDTCATAILKLMEISCKENRIFHLFNQNHVTLSQFIKILQKIKKFDIIDDNDFIELINTILKKKNSDKILSGIIKDFDTDKKISYRSNITVSNDFSNSLLQKLDFTWPIITDDYLEKFIKYILNLK